MSKDDERPFLGSWSGDYATGIGQLHYLIGFQVGPKGENRDNTNVGLWYDYWMDAMVRRKESGLDFGTDIFMLWKYRD